MILDCVLKKYKVEPKLAVVLKACTTSCFMDENKKLLGKAKSLLLKNVARSTFSPAIFISTNLMAFHVKL